MAPSWSGGRLSDPDTGDHILLRRRYGLYYDMKLGKALQRIYILPVGDNFTMELKMRLIASRYIKCDR